MGTKWTWHDWIPGLLLGLLFINCSRKFGAGLWFMLIATGLRLKDKIDIETFATLMVLAAVLIGGGTVLDALLGWVKARFGGSNAPAPGAQ